MTMQDDITLLLLGFLLTTVVGGILGYFFQTRAWKHQNDAHLFETERQAATAVLEDLSMIMDKRLYRMRQLFWKLGATDDDLVKLHMEKYREVLYEWNDNLNRNLARVESYFGEAVRGELERTIYEKFAQIGSQLEQHYAAPTAGTDTSGLEEIERDLNQLSDLIYGLNVWMMSLIQDGKIGSWREGTGRAGYLSRA
jgi:hypothetical protein